MVGLGGVAPSACSSGGEAPSGVLREERGDTAVVVNARPVFADTIEPVLEQVWGEDHGRPDEVFTEISAFDVGPGGRIYVHDLHRGVRWFGEDGELGGTWAPWGEGPHEVGHAAAMAISARGEIALWDVGNGKILFGDTTSPGSSIPVPRRRPAYDESALVIGPTGELWVRFAKGPESSGALLPAPVFGGLEGGELGDTLWLSIAFGGACDTSFDPRYSVGYWDDKRAPWWPFVLSALGRDLTLVAGCSADSSFFVVRHGQITKVSWPQPRLEVGDEERAFFQEWRPIPPLPASRPAIARILIAVGGRIWVWPNQPPDRWTPSSEVQDASGVATALRIGEHGAFEVFERDGRWLGTVALPPDVRYSGYPTTPAIRIHGDTIWAVRTDALGVQTIGRYHVDWPGAGYRSRARGSTSPAGIGG